jgi:hypothetical protein
LKFQDVLVTRSETARTVAFRLTDEDGRWTDVLTMPARTVCGSHSRRIAGDGGAQALA